MTTNGGNGGRTTEELAGTLRNLIEEGGIPVGTLLSSVRQISEQYGVSSKTAHRALKMLASDGLIAAEPSRGYRVLPKANDPEADAPMAYVLDSTVGPDQWNEQHRRILSALQEACLARGWSLLSIPSQNASAKEIVTKIRAARAFGVALDLSDPVVVQEIYSAGIPAVMVDCGEDDVSADILIQDGQQGGRRAVEYLAGIGCRRIAWIGNTCTTAHSRDRFSGAQLGMHMTGLGYFSPECLLDLDPIALFGDTVDPTRDGLFLSAIRDLLSTNPRPDGIVVLWMSLAILVKQAADELGLVLGKDFHLVTWAMRDLLASSYATVFGDAPFPPTITWDVQTMAETAVARLAERRLNPNLPFLRIKIPAKLRLRNEA